MATSSSSAQELVPPINFSLVCQGVYRSGYPTKKNYPFLRALRLRSIIYMCPEEYSESNLKFCEEIGITVLRFPTEGNKEPFTDISEALMHRVLSALCDTRHHPALIHCNKGKHRTGTVCGCLRLLQGWSLGSIFREYKAFSGNKARVSDQTFIELYDPIVKITPAYVARWLSVCPRVKIVFTDRELMEEEAIQMGSSLLAPMPKPEKASKKQQQAPPPAAAASVTGGGGSTVTTGSAPAPSSTVAGPGSSPRSPAVGLPTVGSPHTLPPSPATTATTAVTGAPATSATSTPAVAARSIDKDTHASKSAAASTTRRAAAGGGVTVGSSSGGQAGALRASAASSGGRPSSLAGSFAAPSGGGSAGGKKSNSTGGSGAASSSGNSHGIVSGARRPSSSAPPPSAQAQPSTNVSANAPTGTGNGSSVESRKRNANAK